MDIPDGTINDVMKFTGAKTKREAVVTALEKFNRLQRRREVNARVKGTFVDLMTQEDLKVMREDVKWAKTR
jgi:hypothetical protein